MTDTGAPRLLSNGQGRTRNIFLNAYIPLSPSTTPANSTYCRLMSATMDHIHNASDDIVRKALLAICSKDPYINNQAAKAIDKLEKKNAEVAASTPAATAPGDAERNAAAGDVAICTQCREAFAETENSSTACCWHPGESHKQPAQSLSSKDGPKC